MSSIETYTMIRINDSGKTENYLISTRYFPLFKCVVNACQDEKTQRVMAIKTVRTIGETLHVQPMGDRDRESFESHFTISLWAAKTLAENGIE